MSHEKIRKFRGNKDDKDIRDFKDDNEFKRMRYEED